MAESEEELKGFLMKVEKESEKAGLKLNIRKTKIMAPGPVSLRQIEEGKEAALTDSVFLGSQITADGDCNHEIKRRLLPGRIAMTSLESIMYQKAETSLCWQRFV